ncbi:hypothetical protein [Methyloferula stellata]|uniref:hypothetical protein n=1 Tax=Methyloferula stellata TaxID=876270 RepID=UPI000479AC73|nr:hypothetical protein [Methyloferula stellata]
MFESIQIGNLWYPTRDAGLRLATYCKHLFASTDDQQFPHFFPGSGTALQINGRFFLFCCQHQISHVEPEKIGFRLAHENKIAIPSALWAHNPEPVSDDTDLLDVRAFEYKPENYDGIPIEANFFDVQDDLCWPRHASGPLWVCGYPTQLQTYHDDGQGMVAVPTYIDGQYLGATSSPHLHKLRIVRPDGFDPDGMSGGPVFYMGRRGQRDFMGLAGMIMRGSKSSDVLHFMTSDALRALVNAPTIDHARDEPAT